ncbi:flagellar type III secretion system protein FlhB [Halocynthiibacter sp. C4]|uniref:EscU/YscU/HrcU family type III secretion system export apparatus switch protein n=1 Tax=Halocynthiibacter sp. C4 TaxID=2992758 RepID=UPI00237BF325|nr:flagellar type III secretion system protein FlhB [Halocynthiibacter sp. C4]MDE0591349.1 flagellar type III secretion system protein FlhB [Halocynthiibacter sp. C4]
MSQNDEGEKQYEASQQKLDDARKKGEIPRSTDLITAASFTGFLIALFVFGPNAIPRSAAALSILLHSPQNFVAATTSASLTGAIASSLFPLAPLFVLPVVMVIGVVFFQKGFVFAPAKLEPKLSKISPLSNLKNKFGRSGLFEFGKSTAKLVLVSIILGVFLAKKRDVILSIAKLSAQQAIIGMMSLIVQFVMVVVLISVCIGAVDYLFQYKEHHRKNMMSRKELTDEQKNSEGDPHQKGQRRQRGQEIALNRMMTEVPKADVVLVNPTHFAVALVWNKKNGGAPVCVAKGVDEVAMRIRETAMENGVPIHRDPPATRAIYATVELGEEVHAEHYEAVALAIRFAESVRKKAGKLT